MPPFRFGNWAKKVPKIELITFKFVVFRVPVPEIIIDYFLNQVELYFAKKMLCTSGMRPVCSFCGRIILTAILEILWFKIEITLELVNAKKRESKSPIGCKRIYSWQMRALEHCDTHQVIHNPLHLALNWNYILF